MKKGAGTRGQVKPAAPAMSSSVSPSSLLTHRKAEADQVLGPPHPVGQPHGLTGRWLQPGPVLTLAGTWGVNHQMEDRCLSHKFQLCPQLSVLLPTSLVLGPPVCQAGSISKQRVGYRHRKCQRCLLPRPGRHDSFPWTPTSSPGDTSPCTAALPAAIPNCDLTPACNTQ